MLASSAQAVTDNRMRTSNCNPVALVYSPGHNHFWILDDVTNMDVVVGPRGNTFITLIRALATLFPSHIP